MDSNYNLTFIIESGANMKEYTVKDYTTGKEYQYKTMNEAQAKQELLVFVYGHDTEVL